MPPPPQKKKLASPVLGRKSLMPALRSAKLLECLVRPHGSGRAGPQRNYKPKDQGNEAQTIAIRPKPAPFSSHYLDTRHTSLNTFQNYSPTLVQIIKMVVFQ
jgi:hypothetical protein